MTLTTDAETAYRPPRRCANLLSRLRECDGVRLLGHFHHYVLRSMSTLLQNTVGFELNDGWRISSVLVGVDDPRRGMVLPAQGFGRKASAAAESRLAERRKSIVAPVESTARYKYTHLPFTRTYVSSTRQESFVGLSRLRSLSVTKTS